MSLPAGVMPYLTVNDAKAAIDFYTRAFGAKELMSLPFKDGKRLIHVSMSINGGEIAFADDFADVDMAGCESRTPQKLGGSPVILHMNVPDCDAAVKKAVDAGAVCTLKPQDTFWQARYAQVRDPFGHVWALMTPL